MRHRQSLRAYAKSLVGGHADAEDVVQDAFRVAWELACARPSLPPPPVTWLREQIRKNAAEVRAHRSTFRSRPLSAW